MFEKCCGRGGAAICEIDENGSYKNPVSLKNFVYTNSELQTIRFDREFLPAQWSHTCDRCGGTCEWVNVPNKVWEQLGLSKEFICVRCMSELIDPSLSGTTEDLAQAILSRRQKFNLKEKNEFFESTLPGDYALMEMFSIDVPPYTKEQFFDHSLTPRKETVVHAVPRFHRNGVYRNVRLQRRQFLLFPPMSLWPVYEYAVSDRLWIIETQIKNQFEQHCKEQNWPVEKMVNWLSDMDDSEAICVQSKAA